MHVRRSKKKPRSEDTLSAVVLQSAACDSTSHQPYHSRSRPGYASSNLARRVADAETYKQYNVRRREYLEIAAQNNGLSATIDSGYAFWYEPPAPALVASSVFVGPDAALADTAIPLQTYTGVMRGNKATIDAVHFRGFLDFQHGAPGPVDAVPRGIAVLALVYWIDPHAVRAAPIELPAAFHVWDDDFDIKTQPWSQLNTDNIGNAVVLWQKSYRGGIDDNISYINIDEFIPVDLPCEATHVPENLEPLIAYNPFFMSVAATNKGLLCLYANGNLTWAEATSVPYFKLSVSTYFH